MGTWKLGAVLLAVALWIWGGVAAAATLTVTSEADSGTGSLREAVGNTNPDDAIIFASNVNTIDITTDTAISIIDANLTITGNITGDTTTTITDTTNAPRAAAIFYASAGNGLNLAKLTFTGIARESSDISGGGIVQGYSTMVSVILGGIDAVFLRNTVETTSTSKALAGGGLVGAYAYNHSAEIGTVSGTFGSTTAGGLNTVTAAAAIEGGGLVGAWSRASSSSATVGNVGGITAAFLQNTVAAGGSGGFGISGGGLVGAYAGSVVAEIGAVSGVFGSATTRNTVTTSSSIYGGGLVGAFSMAAARVGNIDANFLQNMVEPQGSLRGGGLAGASAAMGAAEVGTVSGRFGSETTVNTVIANTYLQGGGLVGAWSQGSSVKIGNILSDANFLQNKVKTNSDSIRGGGLVGAYAMSDEAEIGTVSGVYGTETANILNTVTANKSIEGGGLVGAAGMKSAAVGNIDVVFLQNKVETEGSGANGYIYGGGLVGAYASDNAGTAEIGTVSGTFGSTTSGIRNSVTAKMSIQGGGLVGANGKASATVGNIDANFSQNTVETKGSGGYIFGGGLLGANSVLGAAEVGTVSGTFGSETTSNTVISNDAIEGGGLVGARSQSASAKIGDIDAHFMRNTVTTSGTYIFGGGLVGAYAYASASPATLAAVSGAFSDNTVTIGTYLNGGGIIGAYATGTASLGAISGSYADNEVNVGTYLAGGGIIGANSGDIAKAAAIGDVANAAFTANTVTIGEKAAANAAYAYGGVLAALKTDAGWTIADTTFTDNSLVITNHKQAVTAGTVFAGTSRAAADVTIAGDTTFSGNTIAYDSADPVTNAIHFGREWNTGGGGSLHDSSADASLTLAPGAGKTVTLMDPVSVDMNNGKAFAYRVAGPGTAVLGGTSRLDAAGGSSFTASGDTLFLATDFTLTKESPAVAGPGNSGTLDVTLDNSAGNMTLILDVADRDGALPMFQSPDAFAVAGGPVSVTIPDAATFDPKATDTVGRWIVTDLRGGVDETSFALDVSEDSDMRFLTEGNALILSGIAVAVPGSVRFSPNPNVLSAYETGALQTAWLATLRELGPLSPYDQMQLFDKIAANPAVFTAEAHAAQAAAAFSAGESIAQSVRAIAGMTSAGGWQRDAGAPDSAATASASPGTATALASFPAPGGAALWSAGGLPSRRVSFWAGGFANRSEQDGSGGLSGFDGRQHGAAVGATFAFANAFRAGVSFAVARETSESSALGTTNDAVGRQAGLFAELRPTPRWGIRADIANSWFTNQFTRATPLGNYEAAYDQWLFSAGVETGYDFHPGGGDIRLTPFAGARWQRLSQDALRETAKGAAPKAFANRIDAVTAASSAAFLGVELAKSFRLQEGRWVAPSVRVGWQHEFESGQTHNGTASFAPANSAYRVASIERARDALDLGLGVHSRVLDAPACAIDLTLDANASLARDRREYGVQATVGVTF